MVKAPIIRKNSQDSGSPDGAAKCLDEHYLADYLYKICSQEPEEAIRRNRIYQGKYYEDEARFHESIDRILYLPRRFMRGMKNRFKQ